MLLPYTSIDRDDIYENVAEYKLNKEYNRLIIFDKIVYGMLSNKTFSKK